MRRAEILAFHTHPAGLTSAGGQAPLFDGLPRDLGALVRIVQGLLIHEHIAEAYGVTLTVAQVADVHIRPVERMLERITAQDPQPLAVARPPANRLACCCRHVTLLLVAMLRSQGVPARARCGFGAYFFAGKFVDHWVCEYWNAAQERWVLVDAQIDARQRDLFNIELDTLDVPRDRFLVAGDAWTLCRTGKADAEAFGVLDMHGLWFIASNVIRDVAALNNREMLPWDVWGAMALSDDAVPTGLIDRLAALTKTPDESFGELRAVYERDESLRVPPTVFNAVLNCSDAV